MMINSYITASGNYRIDSLLLGSKWGPSGTQPTELTFSFPAGRVYSDYTDSEEYYEGWYGLTGLQQQYARAALDEWSEVANISFDKVSDGTSLGDYGDIRFAYSYAVYGDTAAWAYTPESGYIDGNDIIPTDAAGDIWINPDIDDLSPGSFGYATLLHEIGHALGLKHPFDTSSGFPALNSSEDDSHYTIMSYNDYTGAGYELDSESGWLYPKSPTTPMLYDILAIQYLYGANTSTRTGNDTYTFSNEAEFKTIWDAGGIDTLDLSNQMTGVNINLAEGSFSDIGLKQDSSYNQATLAEDNIAIAFNTEIENAIGSSYADTITGNALDNTLTGGGGNDALNGGGGHDTAVYSSLLSDYALSGTIDNAIITGLDGTDYLSSIETLQFTDGDYSLAALLTPSPTTKSEVNMTPDEGSMSYFLLELGLSQPVDASVHFTTRDGTAVAGEDYIATSGIATIEAGQSYTTIAVQLIDDQEREDNESFYLAITNPVGGAFPEGEIELIAQRTIIDNDSPA